MKKFQELFDFVDLASRNHKYAENTAMGHKAALKLFEAQLNGDEKDSIDLMKQNIEGIYSKVVRSNTKKLSTQSLATYKLRVLKVIEDYEKYGIDPANMNNWISRRRNVIKVLDQTEEKDSNKSIERSTSTMTPQPGSLSGSKNTIDLAIRPGIVISIPKDISTTEAQLIKGVVDILAKESKNDETVTA